ncbi:MAG: RluA family pseudouridine synthase [Candidatus Peribacteraceae bacterium]|jgi:23S rRNA pseudouridine1911/1915/1917 synthase
MSEWTVPLPERLDVFLASEGRMLSRAKAQKAIEEGLVRVNDARASKASMRLQEGDRVTVRIVEREEENPFAPADLGLAVLYEDDACLVLNKPAGVAVHPGAGMAPGEQTLLNGVAFLFSAQSRSFSADAVLVHRLDKDTTGCLLIAKDPASHATLQKQFETRTVRKQYLALVAGVPERSAAMIDAPIGRSTANRTQMAVRGSSTSREAQTTYHVLESKGQAALLLCDLHTGRTHQVRVHLSSIGHPVLGDGTYRNDLSERLGDEFDVPSLCLHAWKLAFTSPADGKEHHVEAPLPREFEGVLERMGVGWRP